MWDWGYSSVLGVLAKQYTKSENLSLIKREKGWGEERKRQVTLNMGWRCTLVVEHLPSICEGLSGIPTPQTNKNLKLPKRIESGRSWEGLVDKHQDQSLDPQNLHELLTGTARLNPSTGKEERRDSWSKLSTEVSKSPSQTNQNG